jgi:2-iminobutanoate/2-iminopropanoate deaminase
MVVSNGFLFLSGQIPINSATGNLSGDSIEAQTEAVLGSIRSAIEGQSLTMKAVVKVTAYLTGPDDFNAFNTVYAKYFNQEPPVRTTVFVNALPKGAKVELDVIAAIRVL